MRKIIPLLFLLFIFFNLGGQKVFAVCRPVAPITGCGIFIDCRTVLNNTNINAPCCDDTNECSATIPTPTPTPLPVIVNVGGLQLQIPKECQSLLQPGLTECSLCVSGETLKQGTTKIPGVWTALGCVHTDPTEFVAQLLGWVMGLGGGIAFLLIVWGGFQILTSSGNPEKLNDGKEIIVSALTGLLMIVFSVILLKIIGVDILQLPGFGK